MANDFYRVYVRRYPAKRFKVYSSIVPLAAAMESAQRISRDLGWDVQVRPWRKAVQS